ncbi:succinylglutamate desuccinylase [bacterium]|nr:succinylglutamate desuccinylase [bacterium]
MRIETLSLTGASAGTRRELTLYRYGAARAQPKVYLQAGLHADEMPGVLVLQHVMDLLDEASSRGQIIGEICIVPVANPIGLSQWTHQRPLGRQDADSLKNFNRGFPDLAKLVGPAIERQLTPEPERNLSLIRGAFRKALSDLRPRTDLEEMQVGLMMWSCDADYVLDLHCDHFAVMHLYASSERPDVTSLLCRAVGARLALIEDFSGANAFDEAHAAPWRSLREKYGARVPQGCFAATLEYRGQLDVEDALARDDALHLMTFLAAVGALTGVEAKPAHPDAPHLPLAGAAEIVAPQGGVLTWQAHPGDKVAAGQVLGHIVDPVSRRRMAVTAPIAGLMFRTEFWRACQRGQTLAHVAGAAVAPPGAVGR